ncbi:ATP-binding protein [Mucilaginibacter sp. RS28]|uniref:histidine kinase n=1 Tax=Mucilaginibacter straminoryzae TaxID=2932774 RepID=A0A9X1WZR5_9SPHI|nr:hybrid sensor histidine kinase/response regulator transcription factor [Mucilaginibacter straminoryzae]MCJ8208418.1 ATP-binding protein [Mucilaginibacter straminoryzae]
MRLFKSYSYTVANILLLIFIILLLPGVTAAQYQNELICRRLQKGLSHQTVSCIYQDFKGFMWFGTQSGLNRYDGTHIVVYEHNPHNSKTINNNAVNAVLEDKYRNLWIGTATGLNKYDRAADAFVPFLLKKDKPIYVSCLFCDHDGNLWIATSGSGLYVYQQRNKKLLAYTHDDRNGGSICSDFITAITEDTLGNIWVGTRSGLDLIREAKPGHFFHFAANEKDATALSHNIVTCLKTDQNGEIWVGTYGGGLNKIHQQSGQYSFVHFKNEKQPGSLSNDDVLSILTDRSGGLWVGTENGGLNFKNPQNGHFEHYSSNDGNSQGLSSNSIWSLYQSRDGLIWIGNYGKGLNIYDANFEKFRNYERIPFQTNTLPNNNVKSFSEDDKGNLWIATDGGGVCYFDIRSHLFSYPINNSTLTNKAVQAILTDVKKNTWIGTWAGGLDRYDRSGRKLRNYSFDGQTKSGRNNLRCLFKTQSGELLVGTSGSGLYRYDTGNDCFSPIIDPTGVSHLGRTSYVNAILEDDDGSLWVGTSYGLVHLYSNNWLKPKFEWFQYCSKSENTRNSIAVNTLFKDSQHRLWIGTSEELSLFDRKTKNFTIFNKQNGLPDNIINGILEEKPGLLWISTNKGIFSFNTQNRSIRNYTEQDGLLIDEFYPGACMKTRNGELFFGGNNGFCTCVPKSMKTNTTAPPVYITGFHLFSSPAKNRRQQPSSSQNISETKKLTLNHLQTSFSVEFAALNYIYPQKNHYQYKLVGFDNTWHDAGEMRSATYTNLDPGKYIFMVKGSNNEGYWNPIPATMDITVLPPWWRTKIAYASYLAIFAALLWLFIKLRTAQLANEQKLTLEHDHRLRVEELSQVKNQFFTNVSHELRTPLSLILAPIEQMLSEQNMGNQFRERLNLVYKNASQLHSLVNELMDFNKLEHHKLNIEVQHCDLILLTREVFLLFQDEAFRRKINYELYTEAVALPVWMDKGKMQKVVINLINNAFKFTPDGGRIIVNIDRNIADHLYTEGTASITVTDNGCGIAQEYLPQIFDRFFQSPEISTKSIAGSGLGLALVKEFIELHGGSIKVTSEKWTKTAFEVTLPLGNAHFETKSLINTQVETALTAPADTKTPALNPQKNNAPAILIAEDNADLRNYLVSVLSATYRVLQAADGEEAYQIALTHSPDLIISDVIMPRCGGIELCKKIKASANTAYIPVILLTAKAAIENQVEGIALGADAYVTKPFNIEVLSTQISQLINSRRELCAHFSQDAYLHPGHTQADAVAEELIREVTDYILKNIADENLSVESISNGLNLSRSNLFRKVKAATGLSVVELIRQVRLKEALKLMETQKYAIAEIAFLTGFRSPAYFTKSFKDQYGKPPTDYTRKKIM